MSQMCDKRSKMCHKMSLEFSKCHKTSIIFHKKSQICCKKSQNFTKFYKFLSNKNYRNTTKFCNYTCIKPEKLQKKSKICQKNFGIENDFVLKEGKKMWKEIVFL